jgi:phosphoribosyl 1,2-cyclic phosphodiesterase
VKVTLWGTRGSLATAGPDMMHFGGNTACVAVECTDGALLVLDAGTGIRRLGQVLPPEIRRIDILLTHLHMDHIQGLGFFAPLHDPDMEVHIWGPPSAGMGLNERLHRYLSPPLFPVHMRDLPSQPRLHALTGGSFTIGANRVTAALVMHPGPTLGFRITDAAGTLAYIPDHEPALGVEHFPLNADWTSGFEIAAGADLLIHDAQFSAAEYARRVGWGHSALPDAIAFAALAGARHLVAFHHDPLHSDEDIKRLADAALAAARPPFTVTMATEGATFEVTGGA